MLVLMVEVIYELCHLDGLAWYDIPVHTKFHDDMYRHSSNIKVVPQQLKWL
jgi:hypothetical protein